MLIKYNCEQIPFLYKIYIFMTMMCRPKWPFLLMCVFHDMRRVEFRGLTSSQRTPRVWGITIIIILLFKLPLIILSPPPLSLIAKVPQFLENFTILSFIMALGAHMRPYSYMYCATHWDRALQYYCLNLPGS